MKRKSLIMSAFLCFLPLSLNLYASDSASVYRPTTWEKILTAKAWEIATNRAIASINTQKALPGVIYAGTMTDMTISFDHYACDTGSGIVCLEGREHISVNGSKVAMHARYLCNCEDFGGPVYVVLKTEYDLCEAEYCTDTFSMNGIDCSDMIERCRNSYPQYPLPTGL